jgi:hypothetical protein
MRPRPVWFFVAWDPIGICLCKTRRRSQQGATRLYKVPASRLRIARTDKGHVLVRLPESTQHS